MRVHFGVPHSSGDASRRRRAARPGWRARRKISSRGASRRSRRSWRRGPCRPARGRRTSARKDRPAATLRAPSPASTAGVFRPAPSSPGNGTRSGIPRRRRCICPPRRADFRAQLGDGNLAACRHAREGGGGGEKHHDQGNGQTCFHRTVTLPCRMSNESSPRSSAMLPEERRKQTSKRSKRRRRKTSAGRA